MTAQKPMVSEVSICNQALSILGHEPITSFADQSKASEWCRNNYPFLRDAVIQERMWAFAIFRWSSESADFDNWDHAYVHPIPPGCLHVHRVFCTPYANRVVNDWTIEGNNIITVEPTIYVISTQRVNDTGKFPPMFVQLLATRIAAEASTALTGNPGLMQTLWIKYQSLLKDTASRDGQQGAREVINHGRLTTRGRL
jgi:hypothetical protein